MRKRPLYYTFGNHMHWVDMQWLWGYDVLPGCVEDMRALIDATGARGNVNFDVVGYEKMAAESPQALAQLRQVVAQGGAEPVGCSYGQPYGLFHGGESNVRQFAFGVRSTQRLLGQRPRSFWEEEFYLFDQLPQILRRCGYTGACLFFQWTWHTPEIPLESASLITWEGIDGSRLPALPRNALNVHQWPEDFDGLLDQGLITELAHPAIVQWLELMPSRDWMCRSEILLPRLAELIDDPRFDVRARTVGAMIRELAEQTPPDAVPTRRYHPDQVWHGLTLGKNADRHPRQSRAVERQILEAEAISAAAGLLGRPYPSWDVYPAWELDEAWRELLAAQHHDNHECEGLCGFVGYQQMDKAESIAREVHGRTHKMLELRVGEPIACNGCGWTRRRAVGGRSAGLATIPPFGYAAIGTSASSAEAASSVQDGPIRTLRRGGWSVSVDVERVWITQVCSPTHAAGALAAGAPLLDLRQIVSGEVDYPLAGGVASVDERDGIITLIVSRPNEAGAADGPGCLLITVSIPEDASGVTLTIDGLAGLARPDPGLGAALRMPVEPAFEIGSIRADSPFAIEAVEGSGPVRRKYPTGDWMTSEQWFETLERSIVSHALLDLLAPDGAGLLVLHDGAQQWFRTERGVEVVLSAYDPWDEARYQIGDAALAFRLIPHGPMRDVERARLAHEFAHERDQPRATAGASRHPGPAGGGGAPIHRTAPPVFAPIEIGGGNALCHAFYRDSPKSGEGLPEWAGHEMRRRSDGSCTHPFVVRLVEWNAEPGEVLLKFPGQIAAAAKTNLMGEVGPGVGGGSETFWLEPEAAEPPEWASGLRIDGGWSQVRVPLGPREIGTVLVDLVLGRKQWRDLDARRDVWATIHRGDESSATGERQ